MNSEMVAMRLELVSAKAKQLAEDTKRGRLWEGDLQRGISEIMQQLTAASHEARSDR